MENISFKASKVDFCSHGRIYLCCFLKETFTKVKLKKQYSGILSFFPLPALPTMCLDY